MKSVIIIGGGIAGLISAFELAGSGIQCLVIEKKSYPLHRVCGEYISNEATPYLKSLGLYPAAYNPPVMSRFMLSSIDGKYENMPLDMGGFGISRYSFDHFLFEKSKERGAAFELNTEVTSVEFMGQSFIVKTRDKTFEAEIVIGAYGKRSKLDMELNRSFILKRSPFVGIKYHVKNDHPGDLISLHNFPGGYCGVGKVENDTTNLCYLVHRKVLKAYKNIDEMEKEVLFRNPILKTILSNSDKVFDKPETINEISFASKAPVENHMLMAGDSAGMIAPLCGNGMAMSMHAAKMLSELIIKYFKKEISRPELEDAYAKAWNKHLAKRLWVGRQIQHFFGSKTASTLAINLTLYIKPLARFIIRHTHGNTF